MAGVAAVAAGAWVARGPSVEHRARRFRLRSIPWELPVLVAAAIVFVLIERGGGLVKNQAVGAHPRLIVLCFPLFVAGGVTGVALRIVRPLLRLPRPRRDVVYLAVRRLAAARALLVLLTVTASVSFCALTFAEILGRSLDASSVEKAYVANGSDVQGLIDPEQPPPRSFPFPITKVEEGFGIAHLDDGSPVEILAVDPRTLAQVVPSSAARKLRDSKATLPAIVSEGASHARAIDTGGKRLPLHVVATVALVPGNGLRGPSCRRVASRARAPGPVRARQRERLPLGTWRREESAARTRAHHARTVVRHDGRLLPPERRSLDRRPYRTASCA